MWTSRGIRRCHVTRKFFRSIRQEYQGDTRFTKRAERERGVAKDERSRGTGSLVFCRDGLRGRWGKPRRI